MPVGIPFENLNRYRQYPFADDVSLSHDFLLRWDGGSARRNVSIPLDFLESFRLVHVGRVALAAVRLVGIQFYGFENRSILVFELFDKNGNWIPLYCKGNSIPEWDGCVWVDTAPDDKDHVFSVSDFDFSNHFSIYLRCNWSRLLSALPDVGHPISSFNNASGLGLLLSSGTVLSMKTPHVMSLMDDVGENIRDKGAVKLIPGYNTRFEVLSGTNTLVISALSGAGAGKACNESGISPLASKAAVNKINGVSATASGDISLSGGRGVVVNPIPGTNVINIYSDSEDRSSESCKGAKRNERKQ